MATIKHTSSKNSDLSAAERYLTFQRNEYTGLPILDSNGSPKLRENYLLDTLECRKNTFAMACLLANRSTTHCLTSRRAEKLRPGVPAGRSF